jgi:epoxyqueuosine reductase QueG
MDLLSYIHNALAPHGLNLIGTTTVAAYEALVPERYHVGALSPHAKTIIVIGNGGGDFWRGFRAYCDTHPGWLTAQEHPLDAYTVAVVETALTPSLQAEGVSYRYVYPFRFWTESVSFMHLARAAGLAEASLLGVVIHPTYGPWMALRAALLIDQDVYAPPQAPGFNPCPTCTERACIAACPAGAISAETQWDIPACVQHRLRVTGDCEDYCRARYDCVFGREHRYPLDELQYHQKQSFATMRKHFDERNTQRGSS